ncbi:unnamed protein product, partial [marine sediment metagenome]
MAAILKVLAIRYLIQVIKAIIIILFLKIKDKSKML